MTDKEIIKALECCWNENECIGDECPFFKPINDCAPLIAMEALDLINRQKAEIENLRKGFAADMDYFASEYDSKIKVESIKEFAERFNALAKAAFSYEDSYLNPLATVKRLTDKLVKEMTELKQNGLY